MNGTPLIYGLHHQILAFICKSRYNAFKFRSISVNHKPLRTVDLPGAPGKIASRYLTQQVQPALTIMRFGHSYHYQSTTKGHLLGLID